MRIRPATNADARAARELVFSVLAEYGLKGEPEGIDRDLVDIEASYFAAGGLFEVVENDEGRIVGTAGLMPLGEGVCELRKMYLLRETRGRGLGKQLLERMLAAARERGYQRMELETATVLKEAIALYERYGFKPIPMHGHASARCDAAYALDL